MTAKIEQQYVGVLSSIPYYYEIFLPFFEKYNIIANWTDCHNTFVLCDNETGKDTGVIGKVNLFQSIKSLRF